MTLALSFCFRRSSGLILYFCRMSCKAAS